VPLRINPQTLVAQRLIHLAALVRRSLLLASAIRHPNFEHSVSLRQSSEAFSNCGIMEIQGHSRVLRFAA
jgi:hypothetical protein